MAERKSPLDQLFGGDLFKAFGGRGRGSREKSEAAEKRRKRVLIILGIVVGVLVALFVIAYLLSTFYTDYLWFKEVGQVGVFWKVITTRIWVFFLFGAVFFAVFYANLYIARRLVPRYEPTAEPSPVEKSLADFRAAAGKWLNRGILALSLIISFFVAWSSSRHWEMVLKYFTHAPAGTRDPIFHKDISFYLFKLPFLEYLTGWLFSALVATIFFTAAAHFLFGAINFSRKEQRFAGHTKAHLSVLAGLILILQAYRFRLQMFETLFHRSDTLTGAHYADVHALVPALWILVFVSLACAALFVVNIRFRGWKLPAVGLIVILAVSILAGSLYPFIIQNYVVKPKELAREREYLGYHIEATQDAYGLQGDGEGASVTQLEFPAEQNLTYQDILDNQATVRNIRLWSPAELLQVLNQRQELRQEYAFNDVDVDRYRLANGEYTQMLVSARELLHNQLPAAARTWQNERLSYTHGYGLCMAPSNEVTEEGDPVLMIKDIPVLVSRMLSLDLTRPELYFNETSDGYVVVRTGAPEIDYPQGDTNVYVDPFYQGSGGVRLDGFIKRLAFSLRFADISLLLSGYVNNDSRLIFRRTLEDRISTVAPFLTLDKDPYLVVDDAGELIWMQDAYTTSDRYPYSQYQGDINYIRNSVKVTVNAYDGRMTFYLMDPADPVAATYARIFPKLFTPEEEMPAEIRGHLRYPEGLFNTQMGIFKTYHINDADAFYQKEDLWDIPTQTYGVDRSAVPVTAFYVILRIPGEEKEEMVLMQPFNPRGKGNMVDWVAARCDDPHYGDIINFSFPAGRLITGVQQFEALVDQQTSISEQITLWNQAGSTVIRGNTLVIPIETSLVYVEPLYLQASNRPIPQIKRVIVSDGNRVVMKETLDEALKGLFGGGEAQPQPQPQPQPEPGPEPQPEPQPASQAELIRLADQVFQEAMAAQRAGDWATYGQKINRLGELLEQLTAP